MLNVHIVQPVVPYYRVAFFQILAKQPGWALWVHSSPACPGESKTCPEASDLPCELQMYDCSVLLGRRLLWQHRLRLRWENSPSVLVINGNPRFLSNYPLVVRARLHGVPVVWWGHGHTAGTPAWMDRVREFVMRIADVWLLYTDREKEALVARGFPRNRVFGLNNTVDTATIKRVKNSIEARKINAVLDRHDLVGKRIVLFCGRITPKANVGLLLHAMKRIQAQFPLVRLVVVGDGPEKIRVQTLADEVDVASAVLWLDGTTDERTLAPWFMSAWCFVYPGAIGLSLLHAMSYGLPVITHDDERFQMPEFAALRPGCNGLTFRRADHADLAEKILVMLQNEGMHNAMARHALKTVADKYTIEGMVGRFVKAVEVATTQRLRK